MWNVYFICDLYIFPLIFTNDNICKQATNDNICKQATNNNICKQATNNNICKQATNVIQHILSLISNIMLYWSHWCHWQIPDKPTIIDIVCSKWTSHPTLRLQCDIAEKSILSKQINNSLYILFIFAMT